MPSTSDMIRFSVDKHVATITICHPPANTWNLDNLSGLKAIVEALNQMPEVSALVIHGEGEKFFSAGADLKQFASGDKALAKEVAERFGEAFETLAGFHGVAIAAVNGYAMGGGLECALACDLRIVEEQAQLALPEATVGLLPCAGGTQRLAWLVGEAWASRMILCGERISANTAHEIGLAQEIVPSGTALARASELAQQVARQSPDAVRACKRLLTQARESAISTGLAAERDEFVRLIGGANQLEGTNAFLEKRQAEWQL